MKGAAFERDFSVHLSTWWTQDLDEPRSDVFWRSTTSGGRATIRAKKGLKTSGQYGDITAIDPIGLPFLKAFTTELKRGYSRHSIQDMIDTDKSKYGEWIDKLRKTAEAAGSFWWMLVVKRDRRSPLMLLPAHCPFPEWPLIRIGVQVNVFSLEQLWDTDPIWIQKAIEDVQKRSGPA